MAISRKGNVGNEHAPASSPAVDHRREIPRGRNDDTRTRITDQANTLNATVIARSVATWQSPGREDGRNGAAQTQPTCLWRLCHRAGANADVAERYFPKNTCSQWLTAEKSPAAETKTTVHAPAKCPHGLRAAPARLPAVAHRRAPRKNSHSGLHRRQNTIIQFSEV